MRHARLAIAVMLILLGAVATADFAFGDHGYDSIFETDNTAQDCEVHPETVTFFCMADNTTHTVYLGYLGPQFTGAVEYTLDHSYETTDLTIEYEATPDLDGGSETDTVYVTCETCFSDPDALGRAWCDDDVNGTVRCDQHYVRFHSDYTVEIYGNYLTGTEQGGWRQLACHETGHSIGLTHGAEAYPAMSNQSTALQCMRTPQTLDGPWYPIIGAHNISLINSEV